MGNEQTGAGSLTKLSITAYEDSVCTKPISGASIHAMINPESYTRTLSATYQESGEQKKSASTQIFSGIESSDLKLTMIVDGTGIIPIPDGLKTVDKYIKKLKNITLEYNGEAHRPNFLKVSWGEVMVTGVCVSMEIEYKLFNPDGSPLRAKITLLFKTTRDFKTKQAEAAPASPDLTHIRTVNAGDTLPLMTYRIYGDASYYMEVARINGLNSVHAIKPGDQIYFPPLKKA